MKPEIAKEWCKDLRSGKFKQTTCALNDYDGFCCLGVLSHISNIGEWETPPDIVTGQNTYLCGDDIEQDHLPEDVRKWAGMKTQDGSFGIDEIENLAALNDTGKTFLEIADIIEKNVDKL